MAQVLGAAAARTDIPAAAVHHAVNREHSLDSGRNPGKDVHEAVFAEIIRGVGQHRHDRHEHDDVVESLRSEFAQQSVELLFRKRRRIHGLEFDAAFRDRFGEQPFDVRDAG